MTMNCAHLWCPINNSTDLYPFLQAYTQALPWTTVIITTIVIAILYYYLCLPMNYIRDLSGVGFSSEYESGSAGRWKGKAKKELAREMNRLRKVGNLPPVYPNGWFVLIESDQLPKGKVKHVAALGENFAVFRGESGEAYVLDAYCPHLGANMAIGGTVRGDCLECPFHAWAFRGSDGQCTAVPYSEKVPEFAKAKRWPTCEVNSFVFVWYHAEGLGPEWRPAELPQLRPGGWTYRGRQEHYISAHIQEIPENGADVAHLNAIHGASLLAGSDLSPPSVLNGGNWARHVWAASWQAMTGEGNAHRAFMNLSHELRLFNKIPLVTMDVKANQVGPGYVELGVETSLGRAVILQCVTPVGPLLQRVVHRLYASRSIPTPISTFFLWGEAIMFERDVMVWNHKKFEERPLLVSEDRAISKFRRWYAQFYSENSPRLRSKQEDNLEW